MTGSDRGCDKTIRVLRLIHRLHLVTEVVFEQLTRLHEVVIMQITTLIVLKVLI